MKQFRVCELESCNEEFDCTGKPDKKFCCSKHREINKAIKLAYKYKNDPAYRAHVKLMQSGKYHDQGLVPRKTISPNFIKFVKKLREPKEIDWSKVEAAYETKKGVLKVEADRAKSFTVDGVINDPDRMEKITRALMEKNERELS